ncbi:hypothetical protein M5K25_003650 [Dendrobium thyrsiflorum]|uniref:RNase H type-1 domain-containing protein n=1 Tax=Dendrobium thyrsiflorum TaxID=117978 RepID=A0ABD0VJL6_DENTH
MGTCCGTVRLALSCSSVVMPNSIRARRNGKQINQIKGDVEGLVFEQDQVEKVFLDYFSMKWRNRNSVISDWPINHQEICETDRNMLNEEFKQEEMLEAIKSIGDNTSPGLDDIIGSFIKFYWNIIKVDLWRAVSEFFTQVRRPLISDFRSIIDHALAKLNAWGSRSLSFTGKRFPLEQRQRKGLHYIAWDELCKPKVLGGMGIHSAIAKTGPLRSRITWRFIHNPNSLCNRIIISKYGDDVWKGKFRRDGSWNKQVLPKLFNQDLMNIITSIKRFPEEIEDQIELINHHMGKSITALAYEAQTEIFSNGCDTQSSDILNSFRKFKLMRKVEIFLWRLCKNGIPTNSFLHNRGLIQSGLCPCDCKELENPDHVAVHCLQLLKIINRINSWGFPVPIFDSFSKCLHELKRLSSDNLNLVKLYCIAVYYSWKRRNQIKLGVESSSINFLASSVLVVISNSFINLRNWDANLLRESALTWRPPPLDWIKINVDATLQRSYNAGIGAIIRDHKGRFLYAFGKNFKHWDISRLELQAVLTIREHLQRWMILQKGVIIEGDNKNVIKWIQDSLLINKGHQDVLGNKEIMFFNDFNKVIFNWIPRCCNKVADCCATLALDSSFVFDSFLDNQIPSSLACLVKKECDYFSLL